MNLANNILDAMDILAENSVSAVKFDKTVRATITKVIDASIGKYEVKYQDSFFYAYSLDVKKTYTKGTNVFVVIPASDFNKDPYITGTTTKSASDKNEVLTWEDRLSPIGSNVLNNADGEIIGFCSYESNHTATNHKQLINSSGISVDTNAVDLYKEDSEYLLIGATFQTSLTAEQKVGGGDYGIKVQCKYWNPKYKSKEAAGSDYITKEYILSVDNMVGQPYNFTYPSQQFAVFEIDSEHFVSITSIEAFCNRFPNSSTTSGEGYLINGEFYKTSDGKNKITPNPNVYMLDKNTNIWYKYDSTNNVYVNQTDIVFSDIRCEFYDALSEEDLQGLSLKITTPLGGFLDTNKTEITLHADLRVQGKKVNYKEQKVNFYWFVKDNRVLNNSQYYYSLGGAGWKCLNTSFKLPGGNGNGFNADIEDKVIKIADCPAYETEFKCVAVFAQDNASTSVSGIKVIYNRTKETNNKIYILSSMGTDFKFDIGTTTLTCYIGGQVGPTNYAYYWSKAPDGHIPQIDENRHTRSITESITGVQNFITYTCSIYTSTSSSAILVGSASIVLNNKQSTGGLNLVLNNGTQVFKYNGDGIAPNSLAIEEYDRITVPALSFDIYNEQGQLISMNNTEKVRMCDIKWFWPGTTPPSANSEESMLIPPSGINYQRVQQPIPSTGGYNERFAYVNQATLSYNIANMYDIDKTENNITLQVIYKNQILIATTNFTFTKDGEHGTNGTKFITRIVPSSGKKIVIRNGTLQRLNNDGTYTNINNTAPFVVQLWNGGTSPYNTYSANQITWSTALSDRGQNSQLTIGKNSGIIKVTSGINTPQNITIKACLTNSTLSENQSTYFDTYPIDVIVTSGYEIAGGYRTVAYQSDGTRNDYCKKAFKLLKNGVALTSNVNWRTGWGTTSTSAQPQILPPMNYVGENVNTWVAAYEGNTLRAYVPIDLHLDRYGLSAMNDWDGSSLKLNTSGNQYILAPQIGAGQRNGDGQFTGVTMGESFENTTRTGLGLFGYHNGQRSIYLDATTGNATFGKTNNNQIKLDAEKGYIDIATPSGDGIAIHGTEAAIQSHDYTYPNGKGMKIKFSSDEYGPYIQFGSGNFGVTKAGYLTAKGGGSIAGWAISNTKLSHGNDIYLDSSAGDSGIVFKAKNFSLYGSGAFNANNKFVVGSDGSFRVGGTDWNSSTFRVSSDGVLRATSGTVGGWTLGANILKHGDNIYLNSNTDSASDIVFKANKFSVRHDGGININDTFKVNANGSFSAANTNFSVTSDGTLTAKAGTIGGFIIGTKTLKGGNLVLSNDGGIAGGTGGHVTYEDAEGTEYTNKTWKITSGGIATFNNIRITNDDTSGDEKILNITNGSKKIIAKNDGTLDVNKIHADGGTIGGWTLGDDTIKHGTMTLKASGNGSLTTGSIEINNSGSNGTHTGSHSGNHTGSGGSGFGLNDGAGVLGNELGNNYKWVTVDIVEKADVTGIDYVKSVDLVKDGDTYKLNVTPGHAMVLREVIYSNDNIVLMKKGN